VRTRPGIQAWVRVTLACGAFAVACGGTGGQKGAGSTGSGAQGGASGSTTGATGGGINFTTGSGGTDGGTTGSGGTDGGTGGTSSGGDGGTDGGTSSGGDGGTFGPSATQLVGAGQVANSPGYRMVFTVGQPSLSQTKTTSPSFRMQGGLVGATETLP
jgi:hypothetical protein